MEQDNVVELRRPDERSGDPLTEVLRHGARALLAQAIEAEAAAFLAAHADLVDGAGRQRWCTTASCRKALRQVYGAAREQRRWGHEAPLALYDFRAEHWKHVRIVNPIEGTFATVRLRTTKIKDCLSCQAALAMVFQLCQSAQWRWRRLDGPGRLAEVVHGVRFVDGERRIQDAA